MTILVTGGAGFIGANFLLDWIAHVDEAVVNLDLLTYAGNPETLSEVAKNPKYRFIHGDICDVRLVGDVLAQHRPRSILHFAAESHVDRSIDGPSVFLRTNIDGTFAMLQAAKTFWDALSGAEREQFRFLHVSTDEVYGSLGPNDPPFSERTPYAPNSPYSASKAASDHLVRAWHHTYGLPVLTTNCSNNYGPAQFPEKLIPLIIGNALEGRSLPIYGDGQNVRDWLYVGDHVVAIRAVLEGGRPGETYNVGGRAERTNLVLVTALCGILDDLRPRAMGSHRDLITFVADRPGHDRRYAIDSDKIETELGWTPRETLETGLRKTVAWYLDNEEWSRSVRSGAYREWIDRQYRATQIAGGVE